MRAEDRIAEARARVPLMLRMRDTTVAGTVSRRHREQCSWRIWFATNYRHYELPSNPCTQVPIGGL